MKSAVVLIIFNRPDLTQQVFDRIRLAKPPILLVVGDGPRANIPGESALVENARKIINQVDWECKVFRNYSEVNLGCKDRPASGLDWVFSQVEEAVILEDDCLPELSFFEYADQLLEKYRNNKNIGMIAGSNVAPFLNTTRYSYYFSRHLYCWGWATWADRWNDSFDVDMNSWIQSRNQDWLSTIIPNRIDVLNWKKHFDAVSNGEVDCWDYQWTYANWSNNRVSIVPRENLISNIGFGERATHTKNPEDKFSALKVYPIDFPLRHPPDCNYSKNVDDAIFNYMHRIKVFDYYKSKWILNIKKIIKLLPYGIKFAEYWKSKK